ncbi:recombination regulator RecX [Staphylococcus massiliensis]|uniref:Regulatory protein RecX n=1 Tax=Staphylococcus massiliensis S46 TaxID=1229783 RepID=K9ALC2_9STAP|nr:recombination regulator RecX [Staphylococcus massiliensis]EKU46821.1 recombination regulator RecX [Staphylococcus massiliensis S46]MCG3399964.1 recombination regulator RecX [Staphylococcus massiliensis]MCG3412930.1 recombination regulator RecX [Staphylococcus massiliensis]POA01561.1 recombination regulator RecX [Staphylococcus massiliensis CCUG 55927]
MGKLTKIEVQKRNKERFNLYIDGEFVTGIDMDTYVHFNLRKGQDVDQALLQDIKHHDTYRKALNTAINYISIRKRTLKEVEQHLLKKEFDPSIIDSVNHTCLKEGYINHDDYTQSLMRTMINTTDKGPQIFKQKLIVAGIEDHLVDLYVNKYEQEQPFDKIVSIAEKIKKQKKGPVKTVETKVKQSLIQKGYTFETINEVMNALDFSMDEDIVKQMLQKDLEKYYKKYAKKYDGAMVNLKTKEALFRKGYQMEQINQILEESGVDDE